MQKTEWMPKEPICHRIQLFYNPSTSVAYKNVINSGASLKSSDYYRAEPEPKTLRATGQVRD